MKFRFLCLAAASLSFFSSCKKEDTPTVPDPVVPEHKGKVAIEFQNYVGSQPLTIYGVVGFPYVNTNGDSFNVSLYKYYVSNIKFVSSTGAEYAEPEGYHLINAGSPSTLSFDISNVPAGTYTAVKVLLGVDSTHNVSGAQSGDLDPLYGMFWTWSSGYIMAKVEGLSPQSSASDGKFSFHLGGFSGQYSVLNEVTIAFPQNLVVGDNTTSTVTFKSDVLKWFDAPHVIKFYELNQVGAAGEKAFNIAKNFSRSLSVTHVQN